MNPRPRTGYEQLTPALAARVDALCDRLEKAWQAGRRPALEDFLTEVPETALPVLLRELILVDVLYRRRAGEAARPADYQTRFPALDTTWLAAAAGTGPVSPGPAGPLLLAVPGYTLLGELGRGGMGVVYRARDDRLGRLVALKVPRAGALADPALRARFRTEARAAAALDHPNLVPVFEAGEAGPVCFIASAYCPGVTLAAWLQQHPEPAHARTAAALVATLADAVQHAHERGVLHRDLKPANVLLTPPTPSGQTAEVPGLGGMVPKITDFGLAKQLPAAPGGPAGAGPTLTGQILGTPSYMAPEQARNKADVGPPTDVYALGGILYHLLTARPPFDGESALEVLDQVRSAEPVPPGRLRRRVPRDLDTITLKCLHKEPRRRYPSAAELADDLRRFLGGQPIRARPVGAGERALKWVRRRPAAAAAYGLLVTAVVFGLGGGGATWLWRRAEVARGDLKKAHDALEHALQGEREAKRRLTEHSYADTIYLAQHEWDVGNVAVARELLRQAGDLQEELTPGHRPWEWHYLNRAVHPEVAVLQGHTVGSVRCVAFSPDGHRAATGGNDGTARLWDAASGRELAVLRGHASGVAAVAFSPDGRRLATASVDRTARLWDVASGTQFAVLEGHLSQLDAVAFSPDGGRVATASGDRTLRLWDAASGKSVAVLEGGHTGLVAALAFSPDGRRLATAGDDRTARLWDAASGKQLVLRGHDAFVEAVAFSPDGRRLATAGADRTARLWDAASGEQLAVLEGHRSGVAAVAFSPDGRRLATAGHEGTARLWDAASGTPLAVLEGHTERVRCIAFSPDGGRLATASDDRTARVWDAASGKPLAALRGHGGGLTSVAFSPDGSRLATASDDGTARLWDPTFRRLLTLLEGHRGELHAVAFSPDGGRLATAGNDGTARLWDAASGTQLAVLEGQTCLVAAVAFGPDGRRLATASFDGTVRVLEAATGQEVLSLKGHTTPVWSVCFSPDGRRLASASRVWDERRWEWVPGEVKVWDAQTGHEQLTLKGRAGAVSSVCFSPDGGRLATAGHDGTARLWDAASGQPLGALRGHDGVVNSVAFGPEGGRLATASSDGTARLWDAASGQPLAVLRGHDASVDAVAFSPDGCRLATASFDRTARLWDAASGKPVAVLRGHTAPVVAVAFSPDGRRLATASFDRTARLWIARESPADQETRLREQHRLWRRQQAAAAERDGRWFAAAFHLSRLIEAEPADASLYDRRGRARALQGQWAKAAADLLVEAALRAPAADVAPGPRGMK
jgi:WD40 repeat protein